MRKEQRFTYRSLDELQEAIAVANLSLPTSENISILATPVRFGRLTVPNRFAVQPMEGCDASMQGHPSDLTVRKYKRFAAGGAGMIWWEACAIVPEGKANPYQIQLTEETAESFRDMINATREAANESMGHNPVLVLQMTHSGRYSRPVDKPAPILSHHSAILDPFNNISPDLPVITDEELDRLQDAYVRAAILAEQVGFDAVDIKSCHRYLLSGLLASFMREDSRYGGSYENRTRMIRETTQKVRAAVGDRIEVTSRINAFDAIEYPYGWGVDKNDALKPDLAEPIRLLGELQELGFNGVNVSIGNPYFNPYVNRPADWMIADWPDPPEGPLDGVDRIVSVVKDIQQAHPDLTVVGSGYSWLRQYVPYFAAAAVERGWASIIGLGRGALAYPDFARDIIKEGRMDPHKVCVACSSCTQIMRDHGKSGCVVRDPEFYAAIYREGRRSSVNKLRDLASQCRRCVDAMCVSACPAGVDVPGFLGAISDGDEKLAYEIFRRKNLFPGICGFVCPSEQQCRSLCIQKYLGDDAVAISEIHRRLAQRAISQGWAALKVPSQCSGKRIAIIGAGPAGLSAAAELLQRGHRVTVFDSARRRGGKVGTVIPPERISAEQAEAEIGAIFDGVDKDRLEWRFGTAIGPDFTLDDISAEGFDAIVLAFGLGNSITLSGNQSPQGVMDANAFLDQMNRDSSQVCPSRIAVIGGGNSASDAAVCAQQHGAKDVYLVYRRSYLQMPAWPKERDSLLRAGVHLMLLCQPLDYVSDAQGRLTGLRIVRTELSDAKAGERRRPVEVSGSEFVLNADLAIEAIGEKLSPEIAGVLAGVELADNGMVKTSDDDQKSLSTTRKGVWAAGDAVNGGTTVVQAIAEGRRAAEEIDEKLVVSS